MSFQQVSPVERPTGAWVNFSYASFAASVLMVGGGIFALPLDWWVRAYFAMGMVMVVQSASRCRRIFATSMKPVACSTASRKREPRNC